MKDALRKKLRGHSVSITSDPLTRENLDPKTEILGVFVTSKVDKKMLAKLPKLKCIVTLTVGYDHIDIAAAKKRGIPVCNVPAYGANTVAQHALSLILALSRKLFPSIKRVKEGRYDFSGLRGFDLQGKTIGVIGTGKIGLHLIDMLRGFDAQIICYDAFPNKALEETYNFTYVSKTKLFKESDIISLHVPLLPQTHHMIDRKALRMMKDGVYIVNTARGGIIDSKALAWGLDSGKIAGAGLDVLEDEGLIQNWEELLSPSCDEYVMQTSLMNNMIIDHPNTIVTPHNAFNSHEAVARIVQTTVENIKHFVKGEPTNVVSK